MEEKAAKPSWEAFGGYVVLVALLWALPLMFLGEFWERDTTGVGAAYTAIAALFTGLAFAGLIHTINVQREELRLQRHELHLQRQELHQTRGVLDLQKEEMKGTKKALEKQASLMMASAGLEMALKMLPSIEEKLSLAKEERKVATQKVLQFEKTNPISEGLTEAGLERHERLGEDYASAARKVKQLEYEESQYRMIMEHSKTVAGFSGEDMEEIEYQLRQDQEDLREKRMAELRKMRNR
uniref:Uncharacterized protein n=1 Tax=Magnetococcus massalia (strain MO-1) TaxID=451514 RepID=A0A1S7LKY5_MAGMO|nr:protein of unknown function [Candidatus Magnetococcus massalia]